MNRPSKNVLISKLQMPFLNGKVLVYHSISHSQDTTFLGSAIHDVPTDQFEKQLIKLKRNHDFVFVDELIERVRKGKSIRKLVSITFDDGYRNFFTNALPVLEHLNIPSTMFLTTKLLQGGIFWRDKVRLVMSRHLVSGFLTYLEEQLNISHDVTPEEFYQKSKDPNLFKSSDMNKWLDHYLVFKGIDPLQFFKGLYLRKNDIQPNSLVQFGNHTESHFMMSSLDPHQQLQEIENAKQYLKSLNIPLSNAFAVPFGNPGSYDAHTLDCAYQLGYKTILLSRADRAISFINRHVDTSKDKALVGSRFLAGKF